MRWDPVDLFAAVPAALTLTGVRPAKAPQETLSRETGSALRGIFALVVILYHLSLKTSSGALLPAFRYTGHLAVAVFFFLSGYGVMRAYCTRTDYAAHFLRRRAVKLLPPYVLVSLLYWTFCILQARAYTPRDALRVSVLRCPVIPYAWYVACIFLFYLTFALLMRFCRGKTGRMIAGVAVWCAVYTAACIALQFGPWRYRTVWLLPAGMVWAVYEKQIRAFLQKRYALFAVLSAALCAVSMQLFLLDARQPDSPLWQSLAAALFSALCFVFFICVLSQRLRLHNPVLAFLGENSLEIYLAQGLCIDGLRSRFVFLQPDAVWVLCTLLGSVLLGFVLHRLTDVFRHKLEP